MLRAFKGGWLVWSSQVIEAAHTTLFFMVPLLVLPVTYELFEFNKAILTYALALVILIFELIRLLSTKKPQIIRPPLLTTGLVLIAALAAATVFSIDHQVSFLGYYGRFQGGLLSFLSYGVIYFSLTQLPRDTYLNLLKVSLFSGALVAAWGALEHLGIDASYWAPDVKARVFSTLGQPNWLAAYLAMLIPWSLAFYLITKKRRLLLALGGLSLLFYLTFVFTYSRGGSLGLAAGFIVFLALLGRDLIRQHARPLFFVLIGAGLITLLFATPFSTRIFGAPPTRAIGSPQTLEAGNETGNIRLVVWQGAIEIWRHNPILGTGLETFGESFYQYRPAAMNFTGEWNYLFNKAHNEYLNYLATTGLVGTLAYLALWANFAWIIWKFRRKAVSSEVRVMVAASGGSVVSYLVQNIFGFTVVPLAVLALLDLAVLGLLQRDTSELHWPKPLTGRNLNLTRGALLVPLVLGLIFFFNLWRADIYYTEGAGALDLGANQEADQALTQAVKLNPFEPNYILQLADARAQLAQDNSDLNYAASAQSLADTATAISPDNLQLWRFKATILTELGSLDPKYFDLGRVAREQAVRLAPTEPQVRLELARFYESRGKIDLAIPAFKKSFELKNDYLEPVVSLVRIYLKRSDQTNAKIYLKEALRIAPTDPDVLDLSQKVTL